MREKINTKDIRFIISCLLIGAISIFFAMSYFRVAFPEAAINFEISKEEGRKKAELFAANRGWDISDHIHAGIFSYHWEEKTILERKFNAETAGRLYNENVGYYWRYRWFRPGEKEEYKVQFRTTGELHHFEHVIPDSTFGDSLSRDDAFEKAQFYITGTLGFEPGEWELMEETGTDRPNRYDYHFKWEEKDFYQKNDLEEKIEPGQGSISSDGLTAILSDSTDYNNCVEGSEIVVNNVSYKIVSKGDRQTLTLSDSLYCSDFTFNYNKSPQASHRISIDVRGSEVAGYHEWIKLPETWKREYTTLRSYNWLLTSIGSSLLNMTFILIFILVLIRASKRDVRWKTAFSYGLVLAILFALNALNQFPITLTWVDSSQSLITLLFSKVIWDIILLSLMRGLILGVMIAGAEVFYRDQYPDQVAFRNIFSAAGLKTKYFFKSVILGLTLTAIFFGYQTLFYLITNELGGWSPREVPDINSLGTYIPWVGVLLWGLWPAVSEEGLSRLFSIPFLQKYTKSTVFAVFVSSLIWGLAHAGYPAQPFYIRVVEVGLGGVFISIIFLRFGILPAIIWHFTIDAIYGAMILLRSDDAYMFTSGILCAGFFFLPLAYSLISYFKNGGFISSDPLVNALDTELPPEKEKEVKELDEAKIKSGYKPLSINRKKIGIIIAALSILLTIIISKDNELDGLIDINITRNEAYSIAVEFLNNNDIDISDFKHTINDRKDILNWNRGVATGWLGVGSRNLIVSKYIIDHSNKDSLNNTSEIIKNVYTKHDTPYEWAVRFYKPGIEKEFRVDIDMRNGSVSEYAYTLADTAYVPSIDSDLAQILAENELEEKWGFNKTLYSVKEINSEEKENRTDHKIIFQSEEFIGKARYLYTATIQGNRLGNVQKDIWLPEEWKRDYDKPTLFSNISIFFSVLIYIIFSILIFYTLFKMLKTAPEWKYIIVGTGALVCIEFFDYINDSATFMWSYATDGILIEHIVSLIMWDYALGIVFVFCYCFIVVLAIYMMWPGINNLLDKKNRQPYLHDALVSSFVAAGMVAMINLFQQFISLIFTDWIPTSVLSISPSDTFYPGLNLFLIILGGAPFWTIVAIILIYLHRRYFIGKGPIISNLMIILFFLFFAGGDPTGTRDLMLLPEFLVRGSWFVCLLILLRYFCRWNPWSYLLGIGILWYGGAIVSYMQTYTHPSYQLHGWIGIGIGILFLAYLALQVFGQSSQDKKHLSA